MAIIEAPKKNIMVQKIVRNIGVPPLNCAYVVMCALGAKIIIALIQIVGKKTV